MAPYPVFSDMTSTKNNARTAMEALDFLKMINACLINDITEAVDNGEKPVSVDDIGVLLDDVLAESNPGLPITHDEFIARFTKRIVAEDPINDQAIWNALAGALITAYPDAARGGSGMPRIPVYTEAIEDYSRWLESVKPVVETVGA